jgi:beta-glucosidase
VPLTGSLPPVTFPRSEEDAPTSAPERYSGVGDPPEAVYAEEIFVGYRWYDAQELEPLFPFGHGLSYTQFRYSNLDIQLSGDGFEVSFRVRNEGPVQGAEVPQVYLGPPSPPPVPMAQKQLVGFERIVLAPGEAKRVTVHVSARELSYWSTSQHAWVVAAGKRPVYVGASSRDIRLQTDAVVAPS